FAQPLGVLFLVAGEREMIEQVTAREKLLRLEQLQGAFAEQDRSEPGASLVELCANLQMLVRCRGEQSVEQDPVDACARGDRGGCEKKQVVLEERGEKVAQNRAEMRQEDVSLFFQCSQRAGIPPQLFVPSTIVRIGLDPSRAARDRRRERHADGRGGL